MSLLFSVFTLVGGLFGGYLGSYMAKKGENKAIHEDIEKLVDQVRAVTRTAEEIKASISTEAWKRDMKKEACYEFLRQIQPTGGALSKLTGSHVHGNPKTIHEAEEEFVRCYGYYLSAQIVVEMVGSEQLTKALRELTNTIMKGHGFVELKQFGRVMEAMVEFSAANEAFMNACRRELGFDEA